MRLSHMSLTYITIIRVAIGVQWPSYFYASFILLFIVLYPPNFFDIPTFHNHLGLFKNTNYKLSSPNLMVTTSTSNLQRHI